MSTSHHPRHARRASTVRSPRPRSATSATAAAGRPGLLRRVPALRYILIAVLSVGVAALAALTYAYFRVAGQLSPSSIDRAAIEAVLDAPPDLTSSETTDTGTYILLLGNDRRTGQGWTRSDTIILARLDSTTNSVSMVSIARDTRVDVPGHGLTKINHSSAYGGPALTIQTLKQFSGLPVHHYVQIDFEGFERIVDSVGGVSINVQVPVMAGDRVLVPAGSQLLNGSQALLYVRDRKGYASGDFARMKNQQTFLLALAKKMSQQRNFARLPGILDSTSQHIETDLSITELVGLASDYRGISASTLHAASVPGKTATIGGVSYVIADEASAAALFADLADGGLSEAP